MVHPFRPGSPEADEATLTAMQRAGADLTRETEVIFYLYFPSGELAERAAESIRNPTFVPEVKGTLCQVTAQIVPSLNTIRDASVRFHAVAATLHGQYDGWVAQVQTKPLAAPPIIEGIKWWVALAMYVRGPFRLLRSHRVGAVEQRALLTLADDRAMQPAMRTYLSETETSLAGLGFQKVARTIGRRPAAGGVITAYVTLLEHPDRHALASVIAMQSHRGRAAAHVIFKNALTDGRVIQTSNSTVQRRLPRRHEHDAISFPDVIDPVALDRLHRFRVGDAPVAPLTAGGDAIAYYAAEEQDARNSWVRAGYYRRLNDGELRITRYGAVCMTWRGKFPWAQLTRWRDARQRAAIYSRLGS